jgi:hypothetical protein
MRTIIESHTIFLAAIQAGSANPLGGLSRRERRALIRDARDTVARGVGDVAGAHELLRWAGAGDHWLGWALQRIYAAV